MSLRTVLHRTPTTPSRQRTVRSLSRALERPLTPSSRDELLYLQNTVR